MRRSWHYLLLWFVALVSLLLNLLLIIGLNNLRRQAGTELAGAAAELEAVELAPYDLPVAIDETLAISLTVPFSDTFVIPIEATVPIDTEIPFEEEVVVPIDTVIPIDTSVDVELPLVGLVEIPIATTIPVALEVNVPISRNIPIELDIPVALEVDIPVQSEVPIRADVPVRLDFPVEIPLDEMGLQPLLQSLQQALDGLADSLGAGDPQ